MSLKRKIFLFVVIPIVITFGLIAAWAWRQSAPDSTSINNSPDGWERRINNAFKSSECLLQPPPKLDSTYYQGRLVDAHFHPPSLPDGPIGEPIDQPPNDQTLLGVNITYDEIVCTLKNDGTSGRVYAYFPVYPNILDQSLQVVKMAMERYPDVFIPFVMPPDNDGSPAGYPTVDVTALQEMLSRYPGLFKGYGEIGLYKRQGGAAALFPDSQRLLDIYPVVRQHNLVVMFHLGEGMADAYEKVIKANPDINFIFHGDQLIESTNDRQDLSVIDGLLARNPNLFYGVDELWGDVFILRPEVGKEKFLAHFKNPEPLLQQDVETWKAFIERHPDQVVWDTDRGVLRWSLDIEVSRALTSYGRAFIARLDPAVQEKYAYKNAERLFENR